MCPSLFLCAGEGTEGQGIDDGPVWQSMDLMQYERTRWVWCARDDHDGALFFDKHSLLQALPPATPALQELSTAPPVCIRVVEYLFQVFHVQLSESVILRTLGLIAGSKAVTAGLA